MTKEITEKEFDQTISATDKPVLVDFWAPWCGPCRAIGPIVDDLSKTYGEKMTFCKMNVDENPTVPAKYAIRAIPTIMIFRDSKIVAQVTGAVSRGSLQDMISKALG